MKIKKDFLRKKIIHMRNSLSCQQRKIAYIKATNIALDYYPIKKAKNVALFLSVHGELNTYKLLYYFLKKKKNIYLPVLHPFKLRQLLFIKYEGFEKLKVNKFKILQPDLEINNIIPLNLLDILIIPTLAFDNNGNRLGMGGGFYDTTLKNSKKYNSLLIGFAYDFQKINKLEKKIWDIPLSVMITPSKIYEWI